MLLPGNESQSAILQVFSQSSDPTGDMTVSVAPGATVKIIPAVSTIFCSKVLVAAAAPAGVAATLILRKYFLSGSQFIDETLALPPAANAILSSTTPLESAEVWVTNNSLAAIKAYGTLIART